MCFKKILFGLLFISLSSVCLTVQTLHAQQKDMEQAIKQGKNGKAYFIAYPTMVTLEKWEKWKRANTQYRILDEKFIERAIYGTDIRKFVSEVHFITEEEAFAIEKAEMFKNAVQLRNRLEVLKKYPDYPRTNITNMSIDDIYNDFIIHCGFWGIFRCLDNDLIAEFLAVFPEYRNNTDLIQKIWSGANSVTRMKPKTLVALFGDNVKDFTKQQIIDGNLSRMTLSEFIDYYGDYESAKKYAYYNFENNYYIRVEDVITFIRFFKEYDKAYSYVVNQMMQNQKELYTLGFFGFGVDGTHKWINQITPFLRGNVDVSYIDITLEQAKKEYEERQARLAREYAEKMCKECEIDLEKSSYPYVEKDFLDCTVQKPGYITMKNGFKQEFYYDKKWYTLEGFIFHSKEEFDTMGNLYKECLKRCQVKYCK
jgi:hypothetical protein